MIEKINVLLNKTDNKQVKALCEKALFTINSGIFQNIPDEAKYELEKAVVENLFKDLSVDQNKLTKKWLANAKKSWTIQNLGVREAVNFLYKTEAKENFALKEVLESYKEVLQLEPEVLLYENFISAMQSFKYFPKVGNAIDAIKDNVDNYESDVNITKILEIMKKTSSSYLVPLIEDLVNNYLENKNSQTKHMLKEGLMKFSYDNFVRDIINLVSGDVASLQLEYVGSLCDIEKVYSPILYLGESEAVFSVKGSYYIKKGNNLSRLNKNTVNKLDKNFIQLCEAINNSDIVIDGKTITIYEGTDNAVISENNILINDKSMTFEDFNYSKDISEWSGKSKFLNLVTLFATNFNEIAEIDFAKRVFIKENSDYSADVFKLRGNISIATYDPKLGGGTFYRNINPIQAKNLMMEHLRFDVSKAFEDLLPDEQKINEEIIETKTSYVNYIKILESKIEQFQNSDFNVNINNQVIEVLNEELNEIKTEYKDYLNIIESYNRPLSEASISLEVEGPFTIDVNGQKYVIPIPQSNTQNNQNLYQGQNNTGNLKDLQNNQDDTQQGDQEFGTTVGGENINKDAASAVTFDDTQSELLGSEPSIDYDEVDLGADEVEADADAVEAEKEINAEDDSEEMPGDEVTGEENPTDGMGGEDSTENDDEGEIKIDNDEETDAGDEEPEDEESEEKTEKVEDSTSNRETPKKKKVYLKKKKV